MRKGSSNRIAPVEQAAAARSERKELPVGKKGKETRLALIAAVHRLLETVPPQNLTAAAITKEAGTSPATFYVYFNDVEELLWEISNAIENPVALLFPSFDFLRTDARLEEDALALVWTFWDFWICNGQVLLYRNMQADSGNQSFLELVRRNALPIQHELADRLFEAAPEGSGIKHIDAYSEASVFIAAMDRTASAFHLWPEDDPIPDLMVRAQARMLVRMLRR